MGRSLRRWITALCTVFTVALLIWAGSGERSYRESVQYRVIRTNFVDSKLYYALENGSSNLSQTSATHGSSNQTSERSWNKGQSHMTISSDGSRPRARVLLVSYMRSGSTFTGDIFQTLPDVFYLYEPLLYVNDDDYMAPRERSARTRLIPKAMGIPNPPEILNYTLDVLNCKLTDHNLRFLYGLSYSKSTTEFDNCQKKLGPKPSAFGACGQQLRDRCERSQAVVSKILRLKMWEVEKLLLRDKDLKVIHLVRDPRGVCVSRRAVRYHFIEGPFCARLNADSQMSAELQVKYPGRILTTRYEDLASNAPQVAKILFDFAGIPWSKTVEDRLINMTSNSDIQTKEHVFNTNRKNSSLTASSWRQKIPFQVSSRLQSLCLKSMNVYGYSAFKSLQELQDQNLSSFSRDYSNQFYKAQVLR